MGLVGSVVGVKPPASAGGWWGWLRVRAATLADKPPVAPLEFTVSCFTADRGVGRYAIS